MSQPLGYRIPQLPQPQKRKRPPLPPLPPPAWETLPTLGQLTSETPMRKEWICPPSRCLSFAYGMLLPLIPCPTKRCQVALPKRPSKPSYPLGDRLKCSVTRHRELLPCRDLQSLLKRCYCHTCFAFLPGKRLPHSNKILGISPRSSNFSSCYLE